MLRVLVIVGLLVPCALSANPERPRSGSGARRPSVDCSGTVGFSAIGTNRVHSSGLISYRTTTVDKNVGFNKETGEVTFYCSGLYHISFAGYGTAPDTKIVLKKSTSSSSAWSEIAAAGGSSSGGGSNQLLLEVDDGDQAGLWLSGGQLSSDRNIPSTSFSAFRISKT